MMETVDRSQQRSLVLLTAGFGGLLLLLAFAGFDAIQVVGEIQSRNDSIRREFLGRNQLLNQIRSDLYLSGTYVRDYLLEPDPAKAANHRESLTATRAEMNASLERYGGLPRTGEARPFYLLRRNLRAYWDVLDPVMHWEAQRRREDGYRFLSQEVFPRRTAMLSVADQIAAVNEAQLTVGDARVAQLFSQFRLRLGATLLVTLLLGLLLAAFSMARILTLEREARVRFDEISGLSVRIVDAQETERRAISRELHDEVGQSLSALLVGLGNLAAASPPHLTGEIDPHIQGIRKLAESTVGVIRNMALLLRPSMLDDLGLIPALQWQAREVSKRSGMRVNVAAENGLEDLSDEHRTCVYRVVQEALHNCSRHAHATTVRIEVRQTGRRLQVTVQDDGLGFRPELERGLGLIGMEERVSHLRGSVEINSEPGHGTLLAVTLPLPPVEEAR